jgi:hypothetical protein
MSPLDDQWEMYDLTADPTESRNLWTDPGLQELRQHLRKQLKHARAGSVPERNRPWPYASRRQPTTQRSIPARLSRWLLEHARSYRG